VVTPQKSQDLSLDLEEGFESRSADFCCLTCEKVAVLYTSAFETGGEIVGYSEQAGTDSVVYW